MSKTSCSIKPACTRFKATGCSPFRLTRWLCVVLMLGLALTLAEAGGADDEYLRIYKLMEQAETLDAGGRDAAALTKYGEAYEGLKAFQKTYPTWDPKLVGYRLKSVMDKMQTLAERLKEPEKSAGGTGQVRLIEAGAEPRKALRLHPQPGDKQRVDLTLTLAMEVSMAGMPTPATKIPSMQMGMELTIKSVSAEGDIAYDWRMVEASVKADPEVLPQVVETMQSSIASLKGLAGTGTVSSRGISQASDAKLPAGGSPQTQQALDQMKEAFARALVAFPEEAVGAGAKWEVKMPIKSQGLTVDYVAAYQLISLDGDQVSLKSTTSQSAANQKIQNPAMPGLKMDLTKMTASGTGTSTLDLTRLYSLQSAADAHTEMIMSMDVGGQKQTMSMKMDIKLKLESK